MNESSRIKEAYAKRGFLNKSNIYTRFNSSTLFISHQREKALISAFKRNGIDGLFNKRTLDVGCGNGGVLRELIQLGASPENLYGIDLLSDRIKGAQKINPNIDFRCGNAQKLPYESDYFDIALLFTVFTSIFDFTMKKDIAFEALRVLRPDGIIIYYDFIYNNPNNPDVRGVSKKEILSLFPNCTFNFTLTLAPPLARNIAPYSWLLCYLLEKIPMLKTHYLVTIQKNSRGTG
jgi:SAM-dependent methyltransferase